MTQDNRLSLPTVTLCAATSVNLPATIAALKRCLHQVEFADCFLFTNRRFDKEEPGIARVEIERLQSSEDYSRFMLLHLARHIRTEHVLVVQWDGFILDAEAWDQRFLDYDYIGAPWPQFGDGHDVGNGGFSLRSKRLLDACASDPAFVASAPEDVAICRINRLLLEQKHKLLFAPRSIAERFAFERTTPHTPTFGFHGVFNLIDAIGPEEFWAIYRTLDERSAAIRSSGTLAWQLGQSGASRFRQAKVILDRLRR